MREQRTQPYPSDLIDREWEILEPLLPPPAHTGRKRKYEMREVVNSMFYLLRSGCTWRMLPKDLPPWQVVYQYFMRWRADGVWQRINDELRTELRLRDGREAEPSGASMDSQSVKTAEKGGLEATTQARR